MRVSENLVAVFGGRFESKIDINLYCQDLDEESRIRLKTFDGCPE